MQRATNTGLCQTFVALRGSQVFEARTSPPNFVKDVAENPEKQSGGTLGGSAQAPRSHPELGRRQPGAGPGAACASSLPAQV